MSDHASAWSHFTLERPQPAWWRMTSDHPPINTVTATTVAELAELVELIESDDDLTVVVFTSRNPDYFLAHYDTEGDPAKTVSMPAGPTGMHPWLDLSVRLSRAPVVSSASIRGRARGAGSEFVLARDIRLAGDEAILAQFETDRIALRIASFDKQAIGETKAFVDRASLPDNEELPPALSAFFASSARPATQARLATLISHGLGSDSELERRLGELVTLAMDSPDENAAPGARS
jgi:hypothetical protein